jgi:two-component system, NtrC family, sensor histidine kinase PilS
VERGETRTQDLQRLCLEVQGRADGVTPQPVEARLTFQRGDLLLWIYLGRMVLVAGVVVAALFLWRRAEPEQTLVVTLAFLGAVVLTAASFWHTQLRNRPPSDAFVYLQVLFDALLVTGVVHVTGGGGSPFAFLYILVISYGALLLPLPGGFLAGFLATLLFLADAVWLHAESVRPETLLQMVLFGVVAVVTGWIGSRVRKAGLALGEMESALRRLRLDTSDILAHIATGILTVDGEGRLLYLNPAGESILGLSSKTWDGREVVSAVEGVAPGMGTVLRTSLREGRPVARSKAVARRKERELVLGISTTILEREGEAEPSVTAIFQDITHQERLSALNTRNERLEAVAELSASLAHEIKNPLASIRSAVEQLSRTGLNVEDREVLERLVVGESDRLSRLLSEFLEFSALKMGHSDQVDLAALARDCLALAAQHPERGERMTMEAVGTDRPVTVPGDPDLLHRAVFNLILNAVQFAGSEGVVRVEVQDRGECRGDGTGVRDPVCLKVSDSGPGVDPDEVPRIFDPFYTRRPGGSGLGLSLVHRAVEAHQGAVLVDRSPQGGAEFSLYLPASSLSAQGAGREPGSGKP